MHWEVWRDLAASSAVNFPITSASFRLVVMWIGVGSTRCTYSGARVPLRFTFTTNLMFFMFSPLSPNCSDGARPSSTDNQPTTRCLCKARTEVRPEQAFRRKAHMEVRTPLAFGSKAYMGSQGPVAVRC